MLLGIKWYQFVWTDDVRRLNEAIQTHCYNPVAPAYPVWAYYVHGRQRRSQAVGLPSDRLEKTTRSSPHHVAQHRPTESETPPYAPRSSRFGSEPPSVEDDVDVWPYAILELHARNDDDDILDFSVGPELLLVSIGNQPADASVITQCYYYSTKASAVQ